MNKVDNLIEEFDSFWNDLYKPQPKKGIHKGKKERAKDLIRFQLNSLLEEVAVAAENAPMYDVPTLIRSYKSQ